MAIIGITGGMGSGKSTVLKVFSDLGGCIFDADAAVRDLYDSDRGFLDLLISRWGDQVCDATGGVDRSRVAALVFSDPVERVWLESHIHPRVRRRMEDAERHAPSILYAEIPLLFEVGWEGNVDSTVAVWCREELVRRRLRDRGMTERDIDARRAVQMNDQTKLEKADFVIVNNGSHSVLTAQCRRLHDTFAERFSRRQRYDG